MGSRADLSLSGYTVTLRFCQSDNLCPFKEGILSIISLIGLQCLKIMLIVFDSIFIFFVSSILRKNKCTSCENVMISYFVTLMLLENIFGSKDVPPMSPNVVKVPHKSFFENMRRSHHESIMVECIVIHIVWVSDVTKVSDTQFTVCHFYSN